MKYLMLLTAALFSLSAAAQTNVTVFGTVVDKDGKGIADAAVVVTVSGTDIKKELTSNKKGKFTAFKIKQGEVTVTVTKAGFREKVYTYDHKKVRETIRVQLLAEGQTIDQVTERPKITGIIVNKNGKPIPEVELELTIDGVAEFKRTLTTRADGRFETEGVANNMIQIFARKKDYRDQIYKARLLAKDMKIDDFTMQTLEDAYAELGVDPEKMKKKPEDQAIEFYNNAVSPYQQEQWAMAEEMAKKAVDLDPTLKNAVKMLVWTNQKQEDWAEVLDFGYKYLQMEPSDKNIYKVTIFAAETLKDTVKIDELKEIGKASGAIDVSTIFNSAVNKINAGDDAAALTLLKEVIDTNADFARAYFEMGKIMTREFEFESAIAHFNKYLELDPKGQYAAEAKDLIKTLSE